MLRTLPIACLVACGASAPLVTTVPPPPDTVPAVGVKAPAHASIVAVSVAKDSHGTSLPTGTTVYIELRAASTRYLGVVKEASQVTSFTDDRGASLQQGATVGTASVLDHGARVVVPLRSPQFPGQDARRVLVRAHLTVETEGPHGSAVLAIGPGEERAVSTPIGTLSFVRKDGKDGLSDPFGARAEGPATYISLRDIGELDRYLGDLRFEVDGTPLRIATYNTEMSGGHVNRGYVLPPTDRPISVTATFAEGKREEVDVEAVIGLSLD